MEFEAFGRMLLTVSLVLNTLYSKPFDGKPLYSVSILSAQ